jgi:hypothetical protein
MNTRSCMLPCNMGDTVLCVCLRRSSGLLSNFSGQQSHTGLLRLAMSLPQHLIQVTGEGLRTTCIQVLLC